MERLKIGVIGCGIISARYFENCTKKFGYILDIVSCADLDMEKAKQRAEQYCIPRVCTVQEMLDDVQIDIILNLTNPTAHYEVCMSALHAGKHIYTEKPFATHCKQGQEILELASEKGLRVGCAPDSFLGAGMQTCRKLIDEGWIGQPLNATAQIVLNAKKEHYHKVGEGPLYDMGPYYLVALISLFGAVRSVTGLAQTPFKKKQVTDVWAKDYGKVFDVETPTNISALLEFDHGVIATLTTISECNGYYPKLEIYGTEGMLTASDPNVFGGNVYVQRGYGEKMQMPLAYEHVEESRGLGLAEMAYAIQQGKPHRASGALGYHVLEVIEGIHTSARTGTRTVIENECERPIPFLLGTRKNPLE